MTTTTPAPVARNGVDVPTLLATREAVRAQTELADFTFRVRNTWVSGTHNRTTIHDFRGAGQEQQSHRVPFTYDADHPAVLVGEDHGPTGAEFLLHALAACLTHGIATVASARGIDLHRVESVIEGDVDLLGVLGLDREVRNGYQGIRVRFEIEGDASPEELAEVVRRSQARSAVLDVLTHGTDVVVDVSTP